MVVNLNKSVNAYSADCTIDQDQQFAFLVVCSYTLKGNFMLPSYSHLSRDTKLKVSIGVCVVSA